MGRSHPYPMRREETNSVVPRLQNSSSVERMDCSYRLLIYSAHAVTRCVSPGPGLGWSHSPPAIRLWDLATSHLIRPLVLLPLSFIPRDVRTGDFQ